MLKLEKAALTDVGRKRSNNQDFLGDLIFKSGAAYGEDKLRERGELFAVADGMGGYAGGEVASELAITTLFNRYYSGPASGDIGTDLGNAVREANYQVHHEAANSSRSQMGTTLTLALFKGNKGIFANVGDSRTYLIRQGIPERVTHDHSLVQEQIDAGILTPEQAEKSSQRNFITRAIGHRDEVDVDLFERDLQPGDVALLCSDGLHNMVKELEMSTIVASAPTLKEAVQQLVALANERGGPDNISVLAVRVLELGEPLPSVLNGREAVYGAPRTIYNQPTEPVATTRTVAGSATAEADPTTPLTIPQVQPTAKMTPVAVTRRAPGGPGLIIGIIGVLVLVAGLVFFVLTSGSGTNNNPTAAPAPTPATATATAGASSPAATAVPLPTVTPKPGTPGTVGAAIGAAMPGGSANSLVGLVTAAASDTGASSPGIFRCNVAQPTQLRQLQISFRGTLGQGYQLSLVGEQGRVIAENFQTTANQPSVYEATLPGLNNGLYVLQITTTQPNQTVAASRAGSKTQVIQIGQQAGNADCRVSNDGTVLVLLMDAA